MSMVVLVSADSDMPGSVLLSRSWAIPPRYVEAFALAMTEHFGPPLGEGLGSVADCLAYVDRSEIMFFPTGKEPCDG